MECKKCKKECIKSEITNGFCIECFQKYNGNISSLKKIDNNIANYFKKWSICAIVAGVILALLSIVASYGILTILSIILITLVISAFLRAIAEIIQLLEDIKNK